jgi:hypothetical protein
MSNEVGHLVLTLQGNKERLRIDAFDKNGYPVSVYVEIPHTRPCRCGNQRTKHKVRVLAPRHIDIKRAELEERDETV